MERVGKELGTEKEKKGKVKERRQKEEMWGIFECGLLFEFLSVFAIY